MSAVDAEGSGAAGPEPDVAALSRLTREQQGTFCIYREFRHIVHAQIERVTTSDWGVELAMRDLESPGFSSRPGTDSPHRWKASASWAHFHHGRGVWSMSYVWTLYLDQHLVDAVTEAVRSVAGEDEQARVRALARSIHEARWPGKG